MVMVRESTVIGAFADQSAAAGAVRELLARGIGRDQIGFVAREWVAEAPSHANVQTQKDAGKSAVGGAAAGAVLGAATALGLSLVPGLGFIAAGGLLASALGGAAFGAAAGTFMAPFVALELSTEDAQLYAREVEAGRTVVVVRTTEGQELVKETLHRHGAYDDRVNPT
jgi:hypothetical protein